jgi:hypothetical protein
MTNHSGILTVEVQPREAARHRRIQPRLAKHLSSPFREAETEGEEGRSRPRFRIDSTALTVKQHRPKSAMRVLLRNAKTMRFLRSGARWTKDPRQARDFHNGWWATVCAFTMNPRHLVIHYEFEDDRYNMQIPVLGHP